MTTLCIDELATRLKHRWGWSTAATHVPADADSPLLASLLDSRRSGKGPRSQPRVPEWLEPASGHAGPPGIAAFHGKASPSVG